jgi:hypothetical protein
MVPPAAYFLIYTTVIILSVVLWGINLCKFLSDEIPYFFERNRMSIMNRFSVVAFLFRDTIYLHMSITFDLEFL